MLGDVGTCVFTPCRRCQLCLASMAAHVATVTSTADPVLAASYNDKFVVADIFKRNCVAQVGTNRTLAACEAAVNATLSSFQGNTGKVRMTYTYIPRHSQATNHGNQPTESFH